MQATSLVVSLFFYLVVFEVQTTWESETWSLNPSWELLQDVLSATGKAVDYSLSQVEHLNLDGIIGLRCVDDQFSLLLKRYETTSDSKSTLESEVLSTLKEQRDKSRNASETAISYDRRSQSEYFDYLGSILRRGQWAFDFPLRTLDAAVRTWPDLETTFSIDNSDTCLNGLLGSSADGSPPCNISDFCWRVMTYPKFMYYGLTHQLLYLEMGEMAGCGSLMSSYAMTSGQGNVSVIQNFLCSHILSDAKNLQAIGFLVPTQDLFLEQIFLCGMLGYQEFLTKDWLEVALTLQDASGCYKLHPTEGTKVKREERVLEDDCGSHKTSMALGALTAYIRFLLMAMMEN